MEIEKDYENLCELYKKFGSLKDFDDVFYSTDSPMPYKNLKIYPVKTIYYMFFHILVDCFFVNKYDSKVAKCIGMNPLQFLFFEGKIKTIDDREIDNVSQYCLPLLKELLLMCLRLKDKNDKGFDTINFIIEENKYYMVINGDKYDWKDFERIRDIICEQNCVELPDLKVHPAIRKKLKEKDLLLAKCNKNKVATFEELVDSLMLAGKFSQDYVLNLSIRRFTHLLERYDIMKHYDLYTILSPNMDKKDREKILSWNSQTPRKDTYLDKVTSLGEIEKSIGNVGNRNISKVEKLGSVVDMTTKTK